MGVLVLAVSGACLLVLVASLWMALHLHYSRKLDAAQVRFATMKREADEALSDAQSRLATMRQQLLDSQLELKRTLRLVPSTPKAPDRTKATESLLTMLDHESKAYSSEESEFEKTIVQGRGRG